MVVGLLKEGSTWRCQSAGFEKRRTVGPRMVRLPRLEQVVHRSKGQEPVHSTGRGQRSCFCEDRVL